MLTSPIFLRKYKSYSSDRLTTKYHHLNRNHIHKTSSKAPLNEKTRHKSYVEAVNSDNYPLSTKHRLKYEIKAYFLFIFYNGSTNVPPTKVLHKLIP